MIEYAVILIYFALLVGLGLVFRRFNADVSDYFRSGCQGTWWMVGTSAFMTAFSAWTFTGAAGAAYEAGWAVAIIFIGNAIGFFLHFLFLGAWFRQLRAITVPEVIANRFGRVTQQFYAWITVPLHVAYAALWLYGLAIFSASVFGYSLEAVILVTGVVVVVSSVFGGSWGVMAADFLQTLILFPITLLITVLCLLELGGVTGFLDAARAAGVNDDFALVHPVDKFPGGEYALPWVVGVVVYKLINMSTLESANRYFAVKDGRDARKAGLLAAGLMIVGTSFWFIPPMAARILIPDAVAAFDAPKPAEASYALISIHLLPTGLVGVMVVAMFSATMSSMDSGLNRNAAIFTQDIYPALCRLFRVAPVTGRSLMLLGQAFSLLLGVAIVAVALYFATAGNRGVFDLMLDVGAIIALPMAVPMLLAMVVKRAPWWAAIASVAAASVPSTLAFLDGEWRYEVTVLLNAGVGVAAFFATMPFWRFASPEYRERVDTFFRTMHRPVDFATEVGASNDAAQLRIMGLFTAITGLFICLLLVLPNDFRGRLGIVFVGGFIAATGGALVLTAMRMEKKEAALAAAQDPPDAGPAAEETAVAWSADPAIDR